MDIGLNSVHFINYGFNGICGDIYGHLDYEAQPQMKLCGFLETWGYKRPI